MTYASQINNNVAVSAFDPDLRIDVCGPEKAKGGPGLRRPDR